LAEKLVENYIFFLTSLAEYGNYAIMLRNVVADKKYSIHAGYG